MCSSKHGPACLSTEAVTTTIPERPMAPSSQESPSFFYDPVAQYVTLIYQSLSTIMHWYRFYFMVYNRFLWSVYIVYKYY